MGEVKYSSRTHYCGELSLKDVGKKVVLMGWVQRRRDHGGLIFIDLRDRNGLVQAVVDPIKQPEAFSIAEKIRGEYVLTIKGEVAERPLGTVNPRLSTGEVEVVISEINVLSSAKTPPFEIGEGIGVEESLRLKYRYLDLRRPDMAENLILRYKVVKTARNFLDKQRFIEIETPILTKSTPEGARDYLVPSRLQPGHFYALPQSPQLFKQLLMVAGFDRYYQIARCFRDEDLRADRQPEHTQIDIEMSFVKQDNIIELVEDMMSEIFTFLGFELKTPFLRISYDESTERFGTDKPDLRYGLEIFDVSSVFASSQFKVFADAISKQGIIAGLTAPGCAKYSRKQIDDLVKFATEQGAKGLVWLTVEAQDELKAPIAKFLSSREMSQLISCSGAKEKDLILLVADEKAKALEVLGRLREKLGCDLNLINKEEFKFVWVLDFPLFEWDEEEKRYKSHHHPFTAPVEETISWLGKDPLKVKAHAYDLVLNGVEIGGGSIRIYERNLQDRIFHILGLSDEDIKVKFGFLLEAFQYGTPPHGGIAFGLDRLIMLLARRETIRDTIAFPKTQSASCLMTGAPDEVDEKQLKELNIKLK